mmetsp:Transcript_28452/g.27423  ORF Transcript_28452/g.27423 Transcript_28452/m.27423 type:complete len:133 (-) Transcript_28452:82-480(-)
MVLQVLHNVFLLSQLSIEVFLVAFELIAEPFVRLTDELGFIANSLEESIINLSLDVVRVESGLFSLVLLEKLLHLFLQLVLFLVQVLYNILIMLLLLIVLSLILCELLSHCSQLLDDWSESCLLVSYFILNL